MHEGFAPLLWNSILLLMLGFTAERALRPKKYAALLLGGAVYGFICSNLLIPCPNKMGAEGALFALIGFQILWFVANYERMGPLRAYFALFLGFLIIFILLNDILYSNSIVVAIEHMGGLTAGLVLTALFYDAELTPVLPWISKARLPALAVLALSAVGMLGCIMGVTLKCAIHRC